MSHGFLDPDLTAAERVIAHRGGRWPDTAENTLEAFRHSAALGVSWLETDVHVSRDGVLYACHDADLVRVAGIDLRIGEARSAELDAVELTAGGRIPRFTDLLDELPTSAFNIDVKAEPTVAAVVRLLGARDLRTRIRLASFSTGRLAWLRSALPGYRTSPGRYEIASLLVPLPRMFDRLDASVDALQVPHRAGIVPVVTAGLVRRAHAAGIEVHVWTINEAEHMRELLDLGVDRIVTDEVARALAVIGEHAGANGFHRE